MVTPLHRAFGAVREFGAQQLELQERFLLLQRPWEEEFLHWAEDGGAWVLHGTVAPPADGRRYAVTRGGWCLGLRHHDETPPGTSAA